MKPIAAPDDLDWEDLPTFDDLREQSGFKVAELRAKLINVPCWKVPGNTVRYHAELAAEAIAMGADLDLEDEPDGDKPISLLTLFNKQLSINAAQAKLGNDNIRAMGEPLRVGVELWRQASDREHRQSERQDRRLEALEQTADRMAKLVEDLLSAQQERDLAFKRHESNLAMRAKTFEVLEKQVPTIVEKWTLTEEATRALRLLRSLDTRLIDTVLESGALDDTQAADLQALRARTPAKPPKEKDGDESEDQPDGSTPVN